MWDGMESANAMRNALRDITLSVEIPYETTRFVCLFAQHLRERKPNTPKAALSFHLSRPSATPCAAQTMANFTNGPTIPMPDFLGHSSSAGDMRFHLQNLLDSKEKQLQQAGTLGQRVLAQQMELEERIRQLQEIDADKGEDDELDAEATERYRELAETISTWDAENAQLSSAFGSKVSMNWSRWHLCDQAFFPGWALSKE